VIGIIQSESVQSGGIQTPDQEIDAYIPFNVARARFGDMFTRTREMVELHQIIAEVDHIDNVEARAAGLEVMLKRFHKKKDYQLHVPLALLRQPEATKRTRKIGIRRAIGTKRLLVQGPGTCFLNV
jgi:putative ABC transport system permease protein